MVYSAALVGLGNIAWRYDERIDNERINSLTHAGAYNKSQKTILCCGCSPDPENRMAFKQRFRVPVYRTIEELIDSYAPDIISLCSPTESHFENASICLEAKIPMIWLEKPPASNLEELQTLIDLQKANDGASKILVGFQRRFGEPFQSLKKLIRNQTLGDLVSIHVTYSKGLLVNGSHYVDLVFFLIGDQFSNRLVYAVPEPDRENPCFALRFENGIMAVFTGFVLPYHCVDMNLVFSAGRASVLYGGMRTRMEIRVEHELFPGFYRLRETEKSWYEGDIPLDSHMSNALSDLIAAYEEDRDTVSNLDTAKNTISVLESVNSAMMDVQ